MAKTIEEKAKAYDKAIKIARRLYNNKVTDPAVEIAIEEMFSEEELIEDEKIRKELMHTIQLAYDCGFSVTKEQHDKFISWIEKQGEHKQEWKPSKEQMTDLLQACNFFNANLNPLGKRLNILLEQLKAL